MEKPKTVTRQDMARIKKQLMIVKKSIAPAIKEDKKLLKELSKY